VIYKGRHYTACAMKDGSLIVTRNKPLKNGQRGVRLVGEVASLWAYHIMEAIDGSEAHDLCRAVVNANG
jgi:hypothetical protein